MMSIPYRFAANVWRIPPVRMIGFDVFGTLVDPTGIADVLRPYAGERTPALVAEWRRSQLEFTFRRAAMGRYQPFDRVTRAALDRAVTLTDVNIPPSEREELTAAWARLPPFPEAADALEKLRAAGHRCVAFSNGTPAGLQALLKYANLDGHLDDVLSVEQVGTYKPAPAVYEHLVEQGGGDADAAWLVSGNAWDVIGARAAGLHAAWVQRDAGVPFDPWENEPDLVVADLAELARHPSFGEA